MEPFLVRNSVDLFVKKNFNVAQFGNFMLSEKDLQMHVFLHPFMSRAPNPKAAKTIVGVVTSNVPSLSFLK